MMDSGIYLLQADNVLVRMNETPYEAESLLQILLERHPDLLAGDQIDPFAPRRWLLIEREAGIPGSHDGSDWWSVDHLFLDQEAIPTFVEVKRASDTRSRREVVAQMLDYAANATEHWPVDKMREMLALRCAHIGIEPAEEIERLVGMEHDEEEFWKRAHANLREGRIRLLFVADKIPPSLQRIVEFLNRQMSPAEVLAVEVKQFTSSSDASLRTLVPRVIGQTEQARQSKAPSRTGSENVPIDEASFLAGTTADMATILKGLLAQATAAGLVPVRFVRRSETNAWAVLSTPGTPGTPCTLAYDYLWISLGRHHPSLKEPAINSALREAILAFAPSARSARDPKKSEVGIRIDSIDPERLPLAREMFDVFKRGLDGN
jgi:hypothetical protein